MLSPEQRPSPPVNWLEATMIRTKARPRPWCRVSKSGSENAKPQATQFLTWVSLALGGRAGPSGALGAVSASSLGAHWGQWWRCRLERLVGESNDADS